MSGQGSGGNVLAALCSLFIPGLGQLLQGRLLMAIFISCLRLHYGSLCSAGLSICGLLLMLQDLSLRNNQSTVRIH